MPETQTRPMPRELVALEAEASARIAAIEAARLQADVEAALCDRGQLTAAVKEILTTAGLSCLLDFVELPTELDGEDDIVVRICLPDHWPICLRLARSHDRPWEGKFWGAQPDDPLAEADSPQAIWRIDRLGQYSFCVHFGTALVRARCADGEDPDEPEIPF